MVITLRFLSGDDDEFYRDFKVRTRNTFEELKKAIQEEFEFEPGQLVSFFLCDNEWNKEVEFTEMDMGDDLGSGLPTYLMAETETGVFLKRTKQRLLFVYDILREKSLFGEVLQIEKNYEDLDYPLCIGGVGENPEQFDFESDDDMDSLIEAKSGLAYFDEDDEDDEGFDSIEDLDSDLY
jgi:hypothetical protein